MQCVGEFETVTSRGNPIVLAVWERPLCDTEPVTGQEGV